ncbi:MAG: cysteine desulfurase family protein [bacterium]|nr:cysteine desulfurase family protein [bacterium]
MKRYYFDYAATTPVDKRVVKAMQPYYSEIFGNPGSLHKFGQEASAAVFKARNKISKLINCDYREIIFTGSATEANNLALRGTLKALISNYKFQITKTDNRPRIIISAIEHESVLETCRDLEKTGLAEIIYLPVSKEGIVDLKKLKEFLNERTVLVSIMYANNEMGAIQPISEIANIIHDFKNSKLETIARHSREGGNPEIWIPHQVRNDRSDFETVYPLFHCDAAQAFNYLNCDVKDLGVDLLTLSSQKIYGPKGVGLLYARRIMNQELRIVNGERIIHNSPFFIHPLITGGGQEEGLRSGTENVAGVAGMAEATQISFDSRKKESQRLFKLQGYFLNKLKSIKNSKFILNGPKIGEARLPNNINIYFKNKKDLIFKLDFVGFAVSGGSACSARMAKPSHVLRAMGCSDLKASESIRISFGRQTTKQEIDKLLVVFKNIINGIIKK